MSRTAPIVRRAEPGDFAEVARVICTRDRNAAAPALYDSAGFVREPALDWTPVPGVTLLGLRLKLPTAAT